MDNEYLTIAIELGLVGVAVLLFYFLWPVIAALVARKRTADPELRDLSTALAGAALAAAAGSATFDSLSFPMFVNVQALVLGLIGAVWLIVDSEREAAQNLPSLPFGRRAGLGGACPRVPVSVWSNRLEETDGSDLDIPGGMAP